MFNFGHHGQNQPAHPPTAPASRLPLLPFLLLALAIEAAMVVGPALAAEAIHLPPNAAVWACLALAVSFHVAIGFKTPTHHFLVFCLVMGALPYAGQLMAAAREFHLHPAMVACIVVAGLFYWAILSLNFLVARRQAEEEPNPQPRPAATTAAPTAPASRLPLLPFLVLALAIAAAMVAGPAVAADAIHLPPNAAIWASLALAVSFHVAIGSIYCFVANRPPPAVAGAESRSRSEAPGAIVASLASTAAVGVTSYLLVARGATSGDRSARI